MYFQLNSHSHFSLKCMELWVFKWESVSLVHWVYYTHTLMPNNANWKVMLFSWIETSTGKFFVEWLKHTWIYTHISCIYFIRNELNRDGDVMWYDGDASTFTQILTGNELWFYTYTRSWNMLMFIVRVHMLYKSNF